MRLDFEESDLKGQDMPSGSPSSHPRVKLFRSARLERLNTARSGVSIGYGAASVLGRVIEGGPIRMSDLAAAGRMHPAALTRQVQALEAEGWSSEPVDLRWTGEPWAAATTLGAMGFGAAEALPPAHPEAGAYRRCR